MEKIDDRSLIWIGCNKCNFVGNTYLKNGACPYCGSKDIEICPYLR